MSASGLLTTTAGVHPAHAHVRRSPRATASASVVAPRAQLHRRPPARGSPASRPLTGRGRRTVLVRATPEEELKAKQMEEAMQAAQQAISLDESVSSDDLKKFYDILEAGTYDEAIAKVVQLSESGGLTEGVVEASLKALEQCKKMGQEPEMEQTLQAVAGMLVSALQQQSMSPALRLVEELAAMKPGENRALVEQRLKLEFELPEGSGVSKDEFMQSMETFFSQMDEQDTQFAAQVEQFWSEMTDEEKAQISEVTKARAEARSSMDTILEVAKAC